MNRVQRIIWITRLVYWPLVFLARFLGLLWDLCVCMYEGHREACALVGEDDDMFIILMILSEIAILGGLFIIWWEVT